MLAHFTHHLLTALPVPMLPFIRKDFNLDYTRSALVVSSFTLSYGIGQLPAGWLADRIGPRILIAIGTCGVALAGVLVGLSQTYVMMLVFLVLMGLAGGGYHPAAAPAISASVDPKKRGRALGFHLIGGSASFFLSPIIAGAIAAAWGWRGSFLGLAVPVALFGIFFYIFLRRLVSTERVQPAKTAQVGEATPVPGRWRQLVAFMVLSVFVAGVTFSAIAFIPLYMVDHFGVSERTAAFFLAINYSAGIWVSPLGGYLSDRFGRVKIILLVSVVSGIAVYLLNLASSEVAIGFVLLVIGISTFIRLPVSEVYIMSQVPERRRSTVYGIFYFSGQESGAVLAPVMGFLVDHYGFYTAFAAAGGAIIAMTVICSLFLVGRRR